MGLDGSLPDADGGDFLSLVSQNSANNKIDVFLERELTYDVAYDPDTGATEATATIELRNDAPGSGLPDAVIGNNDQGLPFGTNRLFLSLYSPLQLEEARLDGQAQPMESQQELDRWVYSTFIELGPGQTRTLELDLVGQLDPSHDYRLTLATQPLVNADVVSARFEPRGGWRVLGGDGFGGGGDVAVAEPTAERDEVMVVHLGN